MAKATRMTKTIDVKEIRSYKLEKNESILVVSFRTLKNCGGKTPILSLTKKYLKKHIIFWIFR
jgi:hypothetical protein